MMVHSLITKSPKHVTIACPHFACSLIGKGTRVSLSLGYAGSGPVMQKKKKQYSYIFIVMIVAG